MAERRSSARDQGSTVGPIFARPARETTTTMERPTESILARGSNAARGGGKRRDETRPIQRRSMAEETRAISRTRRGRERWRSRLDTPVARAMDARERRARARVSRRSADAHAGAPLELTHLANAIDIGARRVRQGRVYMRRPRSTAFFADARVLLDSRFPDERRRASESLADAQRFAASSEHVHHLVAARSARCTRSYLHAEKPHGLDAARLGVSHVDGSDAAWSAPWRRASSRDAAVA